VTKHAPNSFLGTNLAEILRETHLTELVVCGMMSHMCVNTTVRACMDYSIKPTLLYDACATKDLTFNGKIIPAPTVQDAFMASLNGLFATLTATAEFTAAW
jgi:nicotinamidase-related amidase